MGRPLKVFTTGTTIVPVAIARMVGNNHHVGQAAVYVSAPTKVIALRQLRLANLSPSNAGNLRQAADLTADALVAAGLFTEPTMLVTHTSGSGPVVQVGTARGAIVIGKVSHVDGGTTIVGQHRIAERSARFIPAPADRVAGDQ
jgi:hypothetical protein